MDTSMPLVLTLVLSVLKLVSGQWQVIGPDRPVKASVGEDAIFSCFISPNMSAEAMEVRFFRNEFSTVVHLYSDGKELKYMQMPAYQGRTELLKDSIGNGHVDLRLKNVTPSDAGLYGCWFSSQIYYQKAFWELQVSETFFQPSPWCLPSILLGLLCFGLCVCIIGWMIFFFKCRRKHQAELEKYQKELGNLKAELEKLQAELRWRKQQAQAEWRDARKHPVEVTLDPDTAHPQLCVSDLRTVTYMDIPQNVPNSETRFMTEAVVASQGFSEGKHYWEVDVGQNVGWCLGVCLDDVDRTMKHVTLSPPNGYWLFGKNTHHHYFSLNPCTISLTPRTPPTRVGIFLDYEGGTISFFNINDQSLIYTLTHQFAGLLRPYIHYWPGYGGNRTSIVICPMSSASHAEAPSQSVPTSPDTDNREPSSKETTPLLSKSDAQKRLQLRRFLSWFQNHKAANRDGFQIRRDSCCPDIERQEG